jgi:hypothetical protein
MDTNAIVTIDYILASVKAYLQVDDKQDELLMQMILDCITDLNIFHADLSGHKTVTMDISDINTVDLPEDFVDYIKIGRIINNKIYTLSLNDNLATPHSEDCGEDTNPYIQSVYDLPYEQQYGTGGGYNCAEYKIDKRNRRIIIGGGVPGSQIIMEYISSGVCSETVVPRYAVPVIRAYVYWMRVENDPRVPFNEKERKQNLYVTEMRRLKEFETRLTVDEIMDAIYRGYRQTIKR